MKKIFTLLLITLTSLSFAQVELAMKSIDKPDFIANGQTQTKLQLQFTIQNNGAELMANDTIFYTWAIIQKEPATMLVEGNPGLFLLPQNLPTGGTYQRPPMNVTINGTINTKTAVFIGAQAYLINRTNPAIDIDSSNNIALKEMNWVTASTHNVTYNSDNIAVYPNPANDLLNIELLFAESNAVNIELIDLMGKEVTTLNRTQAISPNRYTLDVADLSKGVYILKVTNGSKVSTSKVTISH